MNAYILIINGSHAGTKLELPEDRELTIGSSQGCDLRETQLELEDQHLQITRRGRFYVVSDMNTTSATFVNGHRIATHILHNLDEISARGLRLRYVTSDQSAERALALDSGRLPSLDSARQRRAEGAPLTSASLSGRILTASGELAPSSKLPQVGGEARVSQLRTALDAIYRVSNFVLTEDSPDSLVGSVMDVVMDAINPDRAYFMTWDKDTNGPVTIASRSSVSAPVMITDEGASEDLVRQVVEHGCPILTRADSESPNRGGIISALCVPVRSAARRIGAIYIDQIVSERSFESSDLELLAAVGRQAGLALERVRIYEDMESLFYSCVRALVTAIEAKDVYTHGHSERVAAYAMSIAEEMGVDEAMMDSVRLGALLHDVGKIGVPEAILFKPGKPDRCRI